MATITGTPGEDRLVGGEDADEIGGLGSNDTLLGLNGDDTLNGGDGDDRLHGGAGADAMTGGIGNDVYVVDDAGDTITELVGEGVDTVRTSVTYSLSDGISIERFLAGGMAAIDLTGNEQANAIFGNDAANVLTGGGGGDRLYGRGGDDMLIGSDQGDVLDGGTGADAMTGGAGDDTYIVDDAGDTVAEAKSGGNDRVVSSVTWAMSAMADVETLVARGGAAIDLTGSAAPNTITGNDAANTLSGLGGDDRLNGRGGDDILLGGDQDDALIGGQGADAMTGGAGDDVYYVDNAGDTVTEAAGEGSDTVLIDATWTLGAGQHVEVLAGRGTADIDITGNELANAIHGNRGANVLSGGDGDDTLFGEAEDTLIGGAGADEFAVKSGGIGDIRLVGDAGDTVTTTDTGWVAAGTVFLNGVAFSRIAIGATGLIADPLIDVSGLSTAATFGTTVNAGGYDRQVIDLSTLSGDRGFVLQGDSDGDKAGFAVSTAGDVNGDGFDDFIVGAYGDADGGDSAGSTYVIFGGTSSFGTEVGGRRVLDLTNLSASEGFVIQGDAADDDSGKSASAAGDVNGDGFDDLLIGAQGGSDGGGVAGEAYIVFGGAGSFGVDVGGRQVLDLSTLSAAQGFIVQGDEAGDRAGFAVAAAGDMNGDGVADFILTAPSGNGDGPFTGEAYVIFGGTGSFGTDVGGRQVIDLTTLSAAQGFIVQGDESFDQAGWSASSAGDINGDGFDDVVVGAPYAGSAGEAYVIFGGAGSFGTDVGGRQVIDVTGLTASQGFVVQGETLNDGAGVGVSSAGDVNGDGFDDLIVGARGGDDGGFTAGEAYVIFGGASGFGTDVGGRQVLDLTDLDAAKGFIVQGDAAYDYAGLVVSSAGDINGDGIDDLIVGANLGDDGGNAAGEAYVVFGSTGGFGVDVGGRQVVDLTALAADEGFIVQGAAAGDNVGQGIAAAGDINGDGFDDLIVGAAYNDDGGTDAGAAYVIFGGPAGFDLAEVAGSTDGDDTLAGTAASERLVGGRGNDTLIGNGGGDVFIGGAGDDLIDVGAGSFFRVSGGTGQDTLKVSGDLDFTEIANGAIDGIEILDLTDAGQQTITLNLTDVLAFGAVNTDVLGTTHDNVLLIDGSDFGTIPIGDIDVVIHGADLVKSGNVSFGGQTWDLIFDPNGELVAATNDVLWLV